MYKQYLIPDVANNKSNIKQGLICFKVSNKRLIGLVVRMFANGLGDLGSIPGRVIKNALKMLLDTWSHPV